MYRGGTEKTKVSYKRTESIRCSKGYKSREVRLCSKEMVPTAIKMRKNLF